MKRICLLSAGVLILAVACQDNFVEPENGMTTVEKSARLEKTITLHVKGCVKAIPDNDGSVVLCSPAEAGVTVPGSGRVSGHENILGKFDPGNSTFEKEYCEFTMTPEGPVIYMNTNVILQNMSGEKMFVKNHIWINAVNGDISGYSDVIDGTGRFEGVTGSTGMMNATIDPETGIGSWEEEGYITLVIK